MTLWSSFRIAVSDYIRDPSFINEGRVIQSYAEWVREFCPEQAPDLIPRLIRNLADLSRRAA